MEMTDTETVTFDDILSLATWNRSRSSEELRDFVSRRDSAIDVEEFELA
jgi:hypothetical protein